MLHLIASLNVWILQRFPPTIAETQRSAMQEQLVRLIMRLLIKNPELHYYHGYHEICVTFLLVLGEEIAFHVVNRLSRTHLSVFMEKSMTGTSNLLELIPLLIDKESPSLGMFMRASGVGTNFSMSWAMTWYGQVLRNYDTVGRLFDLFIVSHKYMSIYLACAVLLYKEDEILRLDCDTTSVHQYLNRLLETEEESLPFERLISNALLLVKMYPPEKLAKELNLMQRVRKREMTHMIALRKLFSVQGMYDLARCKGYGFASVTILVVVAASFVQLYWNKSK